MKDSDRAKLILKQLDEGFGRGAREIFVELQIREVRRQVEKEIAADLKKAFCSSGQPADCAREDEAISATLSLTADRIARSEYEKEED